MTHADLAKAMAAVVKDYVKADRAQLETRIAVLEATTSPLHKSLDSLLSEGAAVRERVAILETRPPLQGPPGEKGADGTNGKDGAPGLAFKGVYTDTGLYGPGDIVRWGGSTYHCVKSAEGVKPDARATQTSGPEGLEFRGVNGADYWELFVSKGDPGKAAR